MVLVKDSAPPHDSLGPSEQPLRQMLQYVEIPYEYLHSIN